MRDRVFEARVRHLDDEQEWVAEVWFGDEHFASDDGFPNHDTAWEWAEWHRMQFQRVYDLATPTPSNKEDAS